MALGAAFGFEAPEARCATGGGAEAARARWIQSSAPNESCANAILHQACNNLTAITQLPFRPPRGGAVEAPKGRYAGGATRSASTAPSTAGTIERVMAGQQA